MPKDNSKAARERRKKDAAERQAARDKRTPEQQLAVLTSRVLDGKGGSYREVSRLGGE